MWEPSEEEVEAYRHYEQYLRSLPAGALDPSEAVRTESPTASPRQQALPRTHLDDGLNTDQAREASLAALDHGR